MSSYFDRMSRCVNNPGEFVSLVRDQYRWYLRNLNQEVLVKDLDKLNQLIYKFEAIKDKEFCQREPAWEIQEMHTFAHELGGAGIRLRGGRRAGDNPPIPY
uniref:Uncharacterized protein n=1 Tax=viral metagenome TaxID=1070528 RepID=A0A6M3LUM7_9ZZZZ